MISTYRKLWNHTPLEFPEFSGTRIMMMPVKLGFSNGIPRHYMRLASHLFDCIESRFVGDIGYLTIDERELKKGETLRREGWHVDGYYQGRCGAWGGGGSWGSAGNGMLTVSSSAHCHALLGEFMGEPGPEGEIRLTDGVSGYFEIFESNQIYWVDGACVHRSLPVEGDTKRQFVRLSMPSNGPWFEGYTENPTGIKPTGEILPRREFM